MWKCGNIAAGFEFFQDIIDQSQLTPLNVQENTFIY